MPAAGKKILYALLGLTCTGLGVIGVWVPGLPTTVFILIALWAFSNSSHRLHHWLTHIPILRYAVREAHRFQREGTLSTRVKFVSQGSAWLSFAVVTLLTRSWIIGLILALVAASCSVFMYLTPTTRTVPAEALEKTEGA